MRNKIVAHVYIEDITHQQDSPGIENIIRSGILSKNDEQKPVLGKTKDLPEILFITSYPPRVCGIATYSQDLIKALNNKFSNS